MNEVQILLTAEEIVKVAAALQLTRGTIALFAANLDPSFVIRRRIENVLGRCIWSHPVDFAARTKATAWLLASPVGAMIAEKHRIDPFGGSFPLYIRPHLALLAPPLQFAKNITPSSVITSILKHCDKIEGTQLARQFQQAGEEIYQHKRALVSTAPPCAFRRLPPGVPARFDGVGNTSTADGTKKRGESPISPNSPVHQ